MGKSVYKQLLIDECAAISAARDKPCSVEYKCTPQLPALVTCCDGMVMLNRIGNVMSQPTKLGEYSDDGFLAYAATTEDDPLPGEDDDDFMMILEAESTPKKTKYGTWRHMASAIERELNAAFKRPGARVVVLGFDKKQFVDGVKRVTHAKRKDVRIRTRESQIAKDDAAGLTSTRGIPFKYEDIKDGALVPYPWSETLHGPGQCAAIVRYFTLKLLRFYKPPHDGQVLIIDGHCLRVGDGAVWQGVLQEDLDTTPFMLFGERDYRLEYMLRNSIGEFDHTAFFYVRHLATNPGVQFVCKLVPEEARGAKMHIRTNDTDTLIIALGFLERLAQVEPLSKDLEIIMEIPRSKFVKTDKCINARRMLELLTLQYGDVLEWPGMYFSYGLSAKENDYTEMFLNGFGHSTFMQALVNYPYAIGDIVGPRTSIPGPPMAPEPEEDEEEPASSPQPDDAEHKRKRDDDDDQGPPNKLARTETQKQLATPDSEDDRLCIDLTSSDDDEPASGTKRKRDDDDDQGPPTKFMRTVTPSAERAFQVKEDAIMRLVAACYYEGTFYRSAKQREEREKRKREGKHDRLDKGLLSLEFIESIRKRRKKLGGVTPAEIREKALRHDYFLALTEDLTLGFPTRTIPFSSAQYSGYSGPEYQNIFE
jgi:hypothetical protein